ncbi:hypothetical protein ACTXMP_13790 [Psychrobacter glacincola]|uniref:hypothetical protein n=1 Tax=Psychrobacter TaxID=497 RepID=UPI00186A6587|nr:hypothetical protein [Psychrobacter sp. FME60]MBE8610743.1 hypothetical protein [Pseudomonas lundensis]
MKIWLGLLMILLSFSASAAIGDADSYYRQSDVSSGHVNKQSSPKMTLGGGDGLKLSSGSRYIYKDRSGQVLLTNVSPSGSFDKFTEKTKVTYYKDTEKEWYRQLDKKPAARIGMTQKQVLNDTSWGNPKNTSTTIDASGTSERWIYSRTHSLYFKDGKLIKIEK